MDKRKHRHRDPIEKDETVDCASSRQPVPLFIRNHIDVVYCEKGDKYITTLLPQEVHRHIDRHTVAVLETGHNLTIGRIENGSIVVSLEKGAHNNLQFAYLLLDSTSVICRVLVMLHVSHPADSGDCGTRSVIAASDDRSLIFIPPYVKLNDVPLITSPQIESPSDPKLTLVLLLGDNFLLVKIVEQTSGGRTFGHSFETGYTFSLRSKTYHGRLSVTVT
jgi:hypothetical protein